VLRCTSTSEPACPPDWPASAEIVIDPRREICL